MRVLPARAHDLAFEIDRAVLIEAAPAVVRPAPKTRTGSEAAARTRCRRFIGSCLSVGDPAAAEHDRQPDRGGQQHLYPRQARRVCAVTRARGTRPRCSRGEQQQPILSTNARLASSSAGCVANINEPAGGREREAADRDAQRQPRQRSTGSAARTAEHPHLERDQVAEQQRDADDVHRLERRIGPGTRLQRAEHAIQPPGRRPAISSSISAMRALTGVSAPASGSAIVRLRQMMRPCAQRVARTTAMPARLRAQAPPLPAPRAGAVARRGEHQTLRPAVGAAPARSAHQRIDQLAARVRMAHDDLDPRPARCAGELGQQADFARAGMEPRPALRTRAGGLPRR